MPKKDESIDAEVAVEASAPSMAVTGKQTEGIQLSLNQYFDFHRPDVHIYTRAYVSAEYRGILKTKAGWDTELVGKIGQEVQK